MRRSAHFPRFSAAVLLVATTALFAAPLVSAWEHLSHESTAHGECEAWTVSSGHDANHEGQYEVSEAAHHEHHGVCQALSSLTGIPADACDATRLSEAATADAESSALLSTSNADHPPSRGPPSLI